MLSAFTRYVRLYHCGVVQRENGERESDRGSASLLLFSSPEPMARGRQRTSGARPFFFIGGKMDFLVMLEEGVDLSPVLARVDSVPSAFSQERCDRDVVTLYGVPETASLALSATSVFWSGVEQWVTPRGAIPPPARLSPAIWTSHSMSSQPPRNISW